MNFPATVKFDLLDDYRRKIAGLGRFRSVGKKGDGDFVWLEGLQFSGELVRETIQIRELRTRPARRQEQPYQGKKIAEGTSRHGENYSTGKMR